MNIIKYGVKGYKTNILNQYPFTIADTSNKGGNAVTDFGYTTYGAINQVSLYNLGNNKFTTLEYRSSVTRFSYANITFKWVETVSKYY